MFINSHMSSELLQTCKESKVIPVVILHDANKAVAVAEALLDGGIKVIEVTLRTPTALTSIENIRKSVKDIRIGAGTLLTSQQVYDAQNAGAHFGVSPGSTASLLDAAYDCIFPMLPGVSTVSEIMNWQNYGIDLFKFFPAQASGGVGFLRNLISPFSKISFCPTGGITPEIAGNYLALENVFCVGGSWLTPADAIEGNDWQRVTRLARQATQL